MIILNIFLLAFIIVFCIDYSGFIEEADKILTKALRSKVPLHIPKPFSCGTCLVWWSGLIYLLAIGKFTFAYIAVVAIASAFTPEILAFIYFMKGLYNYIMDGITKFLNMF